MPKISISYRRADSEAMTGRIFDRLTAHYGKEAIFRDIDDIPAGIDFRQHINETLLKTSILLAIVGPKWLGISRGGLERINEESDPVRVEVETALRRRVPIVPVLIGNTKMPGSDQLPPSLKDFAFRNAVKIDTGRDFDYHMDRLIKSMDAILGQAPKPSPPSRETPIPSNRPEKSSVKIDKPPIAVVVEPPRKRDTRPAAEAFVAEPRPKAAFVLFPTVKKEQPWRATLWPSNQRGRIVRISVGAAIAIPLILIFVFSAAPGGSGNGQPLVAIANSGPVSSIAFSPNARNIASGSTDNSVRIWDANSGKPLGAATSSDAVSSVAFFPDGNRIVSGGMDGAIVIRNAGSGAAITRPLKPSVTYVWEVAPAVLSVAVSADDTRIASGSTDSTIRIWNGANGVLLHSLKGHADEVRAVVFSPDGKTIVSGSKDGTVRIWDSETGQQLRRLADHSGQVLAVAISPDGKRIAAGGSGDAVLIWNAATGQVLRTLTSKSHIVQSVAFSSDGTRLVTGGSDALIEMWDINSGQMLRSLPGHSGSVRALAFSPDGRRLASGGEDKTIDIWSAN